MKKGFLNRYKFSILLAFAGAGVAFGVTLLFFRKYESKMEMLVIQKQNSWKIDDAYSAAKSAESISTMLVHVMGTTSFLDRVMASGYSLDQTILDYDLEERKNEWQKILKAQTIKNSGIIKFSVIHKNKDQTEQFASAVANVLIGKSDQYHGGGDRVDIKMIDGPITSYYLFSPISFANVLLGFIIGFALGYALDGRSAESLLDGADKFNFVAGEPRFAPLAVQSPEPEPQSQQENYAAEPPGNLPF